MTRPALGPADEAQRRCPREEYPTGGEVESPVLRLGSVVLTAVLLGVPRALDARAFGAGQHAVYIEVSPLDLQLADFAATLGTAIDAERHRLVSRPSDATWIVEIHRLWASTTADGVACGEAVCVTVRDGRRTVPVVLHYVPGQRSRAARTLVRTLAHHPSERSFMPSSVS